jgi:DNA repair protein RecO (recombination protein O)
VGEGDKILTILTPEYGKIQAIAKGARSYKSKFRSGCQLFSFTSFEFSKRKDWLSVTYAEPVETFYDMRRSIESISLAAYFCDVLCEVATDAQDAADVLRLALNTLFMLTKNDEYGKIKAVFELRLMTEIGFRPAIDACAVCGSEKDICFFSVYEGTVLCKNCIEEKNILKGTLLAMKHIISNPQGKIFSFRASSDVFFELGSICENYLLTQIGRGFRSLGYYHEISSN